MAVRLQDDGAGLSRWRPMVNASSAFGRWGKRRSNRLRSYWIGHRCCDRVKARLPLTRLAFNATRRRIFGFKLAGGKPFTRPHATPFSAARYGAAGNLSTTVNDYAKFLIEVLDPNPRDESRLTRASRDEMIRPHVKVDDTSSWALGWQVLHQKKGNLLSHGGDNPGFKAFVLASTEHKSGYVILTNGDNGAEVIGKIANGDTPLNLFVTEPHA